jgi:Zn-dependent protease with chaperone function
MTDTGLVPLRLEGLSPKAYEHPADRAATAALASVPMLDTVVRKLIEFQYERALRQGFLASSVKLGPEQMPEVWSTYEHVLMVLDMPATYDLYVTYSPFGNAAAIGSGKPMIVVESSLVSLLEPDELRTVLAHEVGHILSDHVLYRTALMILLRVSGITRLPFLANLPLLGIRAALLEWARASELSCDRAATLVNRDPLATCRTMMVLAGGAGSRKLNLDAFLKQATEYEEWESGWDRISRMFTELNLTHAFPVRRVSELMKWVRAGEYDRILRGGYPRREDEPPDARREAGDAVEHYSERFREAFREAGDQVASAGGKVADWLKG